MHDTNTQYCKHMRLRGPQSLALCVGMKGRVVALETGTPKHLHWTREILCCLKISRLTTKDHFYLQYYLELSTK
jgi:hypothetical protein